MLALFNSTSESSLFYNNHQLLASDTAYVYEFRLLRSGIPLDNREICIFRGKRTTSREPPCADLGWGGGAGTPPPPEFAKLNIADITGNEKISYFSYLCTPTFIRQSWTHPGKIFWIRT